MGRKVHPKGFRIGVLYTWDSRWFARRTQYKRFVLEDALVRRELLRKLKPAGVTTIELERSINTLKITLHVVRPGMVIGRGGQGMEEIRIFLLQLIAAHRKTRGKSEKDPQLKLELRVEPVKEPNLSAYFMAVSISDQIARRLPHKRVVGYALDKVMNAGAKGVKIMLAGRIAGAEISRRETYKRGTIPLSTLREDIDFSSVPSLTKSGYVGIKVWICKHLA